MARGNRKTKSNTAGDTTGKKMITQKAPPNRVQVRMQIPRMLTVGNGLRISNREFLVGNIGTRNFFRGGATGEVEASGSSGAYTARYGSVYLAPSAFSWLGTISQGYANYRFLSIKIHYVPIVSTTTGGLVSLVSFPNADDGPNDTSVSSALVASETGKNSIQGPAWDPNLSLVHDCAMYKEYKPCVNYQNIGTSGLNGIFPRNYASSGLVLWWYQPDDGQVRSPGRLYVEYVCELSDPVAHPTSS